MPPNAGLWTVGGSWSNQKNPLKENRKACVPQGTQTLCYEAKVLNVPSEKSELLGAS